MSQSTASIRYLKDKDEEVFFPVAHEKGVVDSNGTTLETKLGQKQDTLVSGTNIKTVNNQSIVGSGNITIDSGSDIDTVSVSVDNNTGTPSATGSVSGSTLTLSFTNLKGATGAAGPAGADGATGPQGPQGPQGEQGNTGSSVAYPYELVNNLLTDDATKGLTAAQGFLIGLKLNNAINVAENGFFVVDEDNNIGFAVTPNGTTAKFGDISRRSCLMEKRFYEKSDFSPTISQIGTLTSASSNSLQGGVNVKNIFFQFHNTNDLIGVYDLTDLSLITTIATGDSSANYHCNDVTLGEYLNEGDRFPLFYVSMQNLRQINVYHISNDYVCTKVQTITISGENAVNGWIDREAGYIYWAEDAATISKGPIPPLSSATPTISSIDDYSIAGALFTYGFQDIMTHFGFQLVAFGFANSNQLQLIDMLTKQIIFTITTNISQEPEAIAYYKDALYIIGIYGGVFKIV